ncbi:MAG: hypothetical protein ACREMB_14905 [Candidatus Rokuibacteriota bacterium]
MTDEDALNVLIACLRGPTDSAYVQYGYEVYLPTVMRLYFRQQERLHDDALERRIVEVSPHFYSAAWELCRLGVLRPGIRRMNLQATPDGSSGNGYSVTPFGRTWLAESDRDDSVPTEPGRFAAMLKPLRERFGAGFDERAQEAVRCYGAHAYLACCAMCGAATESIMLAAAIKKQGEEAVLRVYAAAGGRGKVERMIVGQVDEGLRRQVLGLTGLVSYWRDDAAHGRPSRLSDVHAYTALAMLLRLAHLVDDNWDQLTT